MDEAQKKQLMIDVPSLERELGVPVVATAARQGVGLTELKEKIVQVASGSLQTRPRQIAYSSEVEKAVNHLLPMMGDTGNNALSSRWLALRLFGWRQKFPR